MSASEAPIKVINVVGARPNFVKMAPLMAAMRFPGSPFSVRLVHTGQHYDRVMAEVFFEELRIPSPDVNLEVGSGTQAWQTAEVMVRFEKLLLEDRPDLVLVVGDVNSSLACALAAAKLCVPVAHVEAGLRSFDRTMPEEINRILTDNLGDFLFVSEKSGIENLRREGVDSRKISFVGNVMIDTLVRSLERARLSQAPARLGLQEREYAVLTLHRPASVDDAANFQRILNALERIQARLPIVFPVHPRTRQRIAAGGLADRFARAKNLKLIEPLGYIDFLSLMQGARLVLSDSGGIQEETCVLGVPCITLRENTERPVTLGSGYHALAGYSAEKIISYAEKYLAMPKPAPFAIEFWDGRAAERIAAILGERCRSAR